MEGLPFAHRGSVDGKVPGSGAPVVIDAQEATLPVTGLLTNWKLMLSNGIHRSLRAELCPAAIKDMAER
jgi:hypothetical protein